MLSEAVAYRANKPIAGVHPYFMLTDPGQADYFDSCGGAPEAELITWAKQFLIPTKDFLDIGSHVGTWGITYATAGHCKVVGFEAQPWLARLANAGYALNGMSKQHYCHDYGAWHEKDHRVITAPHADGGGASVVLAFPDLLPIQDLAFLLPIDREYRHVGFMKIDVEGAELNVLQGARATIDREKPTILFECWQDERGQRAEELFKYLWDTLNYRTTGVTNWHEMWLAEPN